MSMFPPANAEIIRNEAGEPLGWDVPSEPEYCDECGLCHSGECQYDDEEEEQVNKPLDWSKEETYMDQWSAALALLEKVRPDDLIGAVAAYACGATINGQARDSIHAIAVMLHTGWIVNLDPPSITEIEDSFKEEPTKYFSP